MIASQVSTLFLISLSKLVSGRLTGHETTERRLVLSSKSTWPECINEGLTVEQCKTRVENEVQAHAVPNIIVKTIFPREPETLDDSYWKVGIPTNYKGQVLGHSFDGEVRYPPVWIAANGNTGNLGPWQCKGWNSIQCCNTIQASAPEIDVNGNYVECFMTQIEPMPIVKADGSVGYCTWEYDSVARKYVPTEITLEMMQQQDAVRKTELGNNIAHLTAYLRDGQAAYDKLEIVNNSCHMYGRTVPALQSLCNDMDKVLHPPNVAGGIITVDSYLRPVLEALKAEIQEFVTSPFEPQHIIPIYSGDAEGTFVNAHPMLGGSNECVVPESA